MNTLYFSSGFVVLLLHSEFSTHWSQHPRSGAQIYKSNSSPTLSVLRFTSSSFLWKQRNYLSWKLYRWLCLQTFIFDYLDNSNTSNMKCLDIEIYRNDKKSERDINQHRRLVLLNVPGLLFNLKSLLNRFHYAKHGQLKSYIWRLHVGLKEELNLNRMKTTETWASLSKKLKHVLIERHCTWIRSKR